MMKLKNFFLKTINKVVDQKKQKRIKVKLAKIEKSVFRFFQKEKKIFVKFYKKEKKAFLKFYQKKTKNFSKKYAVFSKRYFFGRKTNYIWKKLTLAFQVLSEKINKKTIFLHRNKTYNQIVQNLNKFKQHIRFKKWAKISLLAFSVLLLVFIFSHKGNISAATYTFLQSNWGGGASADMASHPDDKSAWNLFATKSDKLKISDDGTNMSIDLEDGSFSKSGSGFYNPAALMDNVEIFGTGTAATLGLQRLDVSSVKPTISSNGNHVSYY